VTRAVVERWRAATPERSHEVRVTVPAEPVRARVDAHALDRIVTNLLGNALTHGAEPVDVGVRTSGAYVVITVGDAGAGMPPELLDEATRRFTRAVEARSRPGSGLGLAIVEQLVVAAGGELRLCHGGHHRSVGTTTGVPCDHDGAMTVAVIVPAAGP
jgi:signal transduction histidine kinase